MTRGITRKSDCSNPNITPICTKPSSFTTKYIHVSTVKLDGPPMINGAANPENEYRNERIVPPRAPLIPFLPQILKKRLKLPAPSNIDASSILWCDLSIPVEVRKATSGALKKVFIAIIPINPVERLCNNGNVSTRGELLPNSDKNARTITIDGIKNVGMIFQDLALFPHMTAYDNIAYGLRSLRYKESRIEQMVSNISETLRISSLLEKFPGNISGGEKHKTHDHQN